MGSGEPWDVPPRDRIAESYVPEDSWDDSPSRRTSKSAEERTIEVPLTEWRRVLKQINELVRLSKKVADLTERAAKAETEVTLLRKQIAELRAQRRK
jgi:hypothetical protein